MIKNILSKLCRFKDLILSLFCFLIAAISVLIETMLQASPCVLCFIQRALFFYLAAIFLVLFVIRRRNMSALFTQIFCCLGVLLGILTALRQIELQRLPDFSQQSSCLPSFSYLVSILGPFDALRHYLSATHGCGQVTQEYFGLSLAHYSLFAFVGIALIWLIAGYWEYLNSR